ncbi:restriction endonuclease [Streptococcus equi subsp. zooepidemicus]|uniref:BglII/BstYI family type II restriction endonuclease n=1 Tax=Streptococcus equi TaxID=1336 RepID=UPI001E5E41EE|nr:BglII/BstYI family type II restriction endonuclease [Streptococcus equi]MCD3428453.1 restriction endonuclease [Streptococcus equi subsp. zooepidemicus]MDI5915185.1 BglII/BstYI family type II restriction endonuclease [Streptococcus equi subsp. zooepidemicus]HEL0744232.1 restriction endonuclease [Streptococcus equi subsp. zooepidemicus]HEL1110141.1 restriction endonuclease [Streptococcus equi subsp. zooepidemicus]HEL2664915.1 restriction endonuclease [Streptococcus equi subsp. zooepidemicus]
MKIRYLYSHLNGLEYLLTHKKALWEEINEAITEVDADKHIKKSNAKDKSGRILYDQKAINNAFKQILTSPALGWKDHRQNYYFTPDEEIAREIMSLTKEEQKKFLESNNRNAFSGFNQTDFLKDNVAIELQFGKYAFVAYDLFVKHMAFYISNDIDVGIEILPTKAMQKNMDTGVSCYEKEVFNVYRSGRNTPAVPLIVIGIEPDTDDYDYESQDPNSFWEQKLKK